MVGGPMALSRILREPAVIRWIASEGRLRGLNVMPKLQEVVRKATLLSRSGVAAKTPATQ